MPTKNPKTLGNPRGHISRRRRKAIRQFGPNRAVVVVSQQQTVTLNESEVVPSRIGWKAYGLACLPPECVPPFFVVDGDSAITADSALDKRIGDALREAGLQDVQLIVRSSGTMETIEQRGRLPSKICTVDKLRTTIASLASEVSTISAGPVHWVVQQHIEPIRKGHLSNERRLSREPRDFIAEFELQGSRPGYTVPVGVRHWREGTATREFDLSCATEAGVTLTLRRIALWATGLPCRVLFEWVWSGSRVWLVQVDIARVAHGIDPRKLPSKDIPEIVEATLEVFHTATPKEVEKYRKLRNAKTYGECGFKMPIFYVLDQPDVIARMLKGNITPQLERDLKELTRRPLVIRTDGIGIPTEQREMLPRSEDLRSLDQAKAWLVGRFRPEIERLGIADLSLALIAHHFIPSMAAAWARSEPNSSFVRIESLWGLPEGLYWHSHDTFEVDADGRYPTRQRLRFKGTFVAPDTDGCWIHYRPNAPFDWGPSIIKPEWLSEIAKTTRKIAKIENRAVAVMWFIGNNPRATPHEVLPWYHTESAIGAPKAAPRRKLAMASDFKLETWGRWTELKDAVKTGKRIERIMLEPKDPELVRNQEFAKELAQFAAENKIVIELAGGVLSHAYHILQRHGAQVECIDLFGTGEDEVEYNKLVRDKVPEIIARRGEGVEVLRLKGEALLDALRQKLVEESYEALDARAGDELIAELADVQEVIDGILASLQVPTEHLDAERDNKRKRRGGFRRGLMLRKTSLPHTLARRLPVASSPQLSHEKAAEMATVEEPSLVPGNAPYQRPDLRNEGAGPEALLTFEAGLTKIDGAKRSSRFQIQLGNNETRNFAVSIELVRHQSSLWGQVKVKLEPSQLSMPLEPDPQLELDFHKIDS